MIALKEKEEMMKVIFLDIDGVLNNDKSMMRGIHLDNELCQIVGRIRKCTGAVIVVSSAWRVLHTVEQLEIMLFNAGLQSLILDKTDNRGNIRGNEIQRWLDAHPEVESYVILDDSCDIQEDQMNNFVRMDGHIGITDADSEKAINILGALPNVCKGCYGYGWVEWINADRKSEIELCPHCSGKGVINE